MREHQPDTVSVAEAAQRLGVPLTRIYQLIEAEDLPTHRDGRRWQIPVAALHRITPARPLPATVPPDTTQLHLAALLEATLEGVYGIDAQGRCSFINPAAATLLGRERAACVGQNLHEVAHYQRPDGSPYPVEACPIYRAVSSGQPARLIEEVLWHRDGSPIPALYSCMPLVVDGRTVGGVVVIVDLRDRQRAEAALADLRRAEQAARRDAETAAAARDEFLASAGHNLRTPLTVIKGTAQRLRRLGTGSALAPRAIEDQLRTIETAADRMEALVAQLLDLTRLQVGRPLALQRTPTDLVALTKQVVADFQLALHGHTLTVQAGEPAIVGIWDRARLEQVVERVLRNAITYSPNGGQIRVLLERDAHDPDRCILAVADEGIGVPAPDLPHVFARFYRGANARGMSWGSGLGLTSVQQVVEQHGGRIAVQSREGMGTTVRISLPLRPPNEETHDRRERSAGSDREHQPRGD